LAKKLGFYTTKSPSPTTSPEHTLDLPIIVDIYPPPLTMDDIWIPSNSILKLLEDLTMHLITVDKPPLVHRSHLRKLRSKRRSKPTLSPKEPYQLFFYPKPGHELLGLQFTDDLRKLYSKK
jgi:hypothetical protein